ncbi:hypothetical protein VNO80_07770 [Phaseolus coccineus]|uniref:Secreted protein n=1 Tax=Phaseolus coccineus TaxID=3886 RepID=A0AAN9NJP2_PHACN
MCPLSLSLLHLPAFHVQLHNVPLPQYATCTSHPPVAPPQVIPQPNIAATFRCATTITPVCLIVATRTQKKSNSKVSAILITSFFS